MATPPALPAPGGNASAALAVAGTTRPGDGNPPRGSDMSYLEEDFDPCQVFWMIPVWSITS